MCTPEVSYRRVGPWLLSCLALLSLGEGDGRKRGVRLQPLDHPVDQSSAVRLDEVWYRHLRFPSSQEAHTRPGGALLAPGADDPD